MTEQSHTIRWLMRRWFRFSLASVMLLTATIAVVLGVMVNRPNYRVEMLLVVDEKLNEKTLLSRTVVNSIATNEDIKGLPSSSKERWLRSSLHAERIDSSNLMVVSMAGNTFRDDTDSFASILNAVAQEIIGQAGPNARVQIVSQPTITSQQ